MMVVKSERNEVVKVEEGWRRFVVVEGHLHQPTELMNAVRPSRGHDVVSSSNARSGLDTGYVLQGWTDRIVIIEGDSVHSVRSGAPRS
jgi:hypothetical protein